MISHSLTHSRWLVDPKWILASATKRRHFSLFCASSRQLSALSSRRSFSTSSLQRYLGRPTGLRPTGRASYAILAARSSPILSTCPSQRSLAALVSPIMLGSAIRFSSSAFLRILQVPSSRFVGPKSLRKILRSVTRSLFSSL
ncbi:hypothetical protein JYU34_002000 [Plutella xylostella]|uniref:Uncharacterized protein n=1 Tax=Plutella xylostella TaxID=51655 RepID=A0ABQ7R5A7_PLUXY|nr:hypothetical protein JYU34_002000 [Plutella xylostella]